MIIVCPLHLAQAQITKFRPGQVISLLSPEMARPVFDDIALERHVHLSFHDLNAARDGYQLAGDDEIDQLMATLSNWDTQSPLLIHCWAGISRSPAAAYIAMCLLSPDRSEMHLAQLLRQASPSATPNQRLIALADQRLGRDGRMVQAIAAIGRGADAYEGEVFTLSL